MRSKPGAECVDAGVALSNSHGKCSQCDGKGKIARYDGTRVCACVYRAIARRCMGRYRVLRQSGVAGICQIQRTGSGHLVRGFPAAEWMADIDLAARRVLNERELRVFYLYEVDGAEWTGCTEAAGVDRGNFFHMVYRIEEKLGRAFYSTGCFSLFPAGAYFGGVVDREQIARPSGRWGQERSEMRTVME